jgi:hypothetical protein
MAYHPNNLNRAGAYSQGLLRPLQGQGLFGLNLPEDGVPLDRRMKQFNAPELGTV